MLIYSKNVELECQQDLEYPEDGKIFLKFLYNFWRYLAHFKCFPYRKRKSDKYVQLIISDF